MRAQTSRVYFADYRQLIPLHFAIKCSVNATWTLHGEFSAGENYAHCHKGVPRLAPGSPQACTWGSLGLHMGVPRPAPRGP